MVNRKNWLGILAVLLVFSMTVVGCDNGNGNSNGNGGGNGGTFTMNNIPSEYNNKYAILDEWTYVGNISVGLHGAQSINISTWTFTGVKISNGSVSIPLWIFTENGMAKYSGNHIVDGVDVSIYNSAEIPVPSVGLIRIDFSPVTFSNGNATKSWNDGEQKDH